MKNLLFALSLFIAVSLGAQEARVISLESKDTTVAREAWENLQHAQATWAHLQEVLRDKYTVVPEGDKDASNTVISSGLIGNSTSCGIFLNVNKDQTVSALTDIEKCRAEQGKYHKEHPSLTYRRGWESGFEFSSDFKYIVPKPAAVPSQGLFCPCSIIPTQSMQLNSTGNQCFKLEGCFQ